MCLTLPAGVKTPTIAERDIYCYKILMVRKRYGNIHIMSPYHYHEYALGETINARFKLGRQFQDSDHYVVEEGLHSFVSLAAAKKDMSGYGDAEYPEHFVFVAIIPKGAKYFRGGFNAKSDSYASDTLMVLGRNDPRSLKKLVNIPTVVT